METENNGQNFADWHPKDWMKAALRGEAGMDTYQRVPQQRGGLLKESKSSENMQRFINNHRGHYRRGVKRRWR